MPLHKIAGSGGLPSSLVGVYGRITGFSISGPLYLVTSALATVRPLTSSGFSKRNRNFLVLWLMFSTWSRARLTKPWSVATCASVLFSSQPHIAYAQLLLTTSSEYILGWTAGHNGLLCLGRHVLGRSDGVLLACECVVASSYCRSANDTVDERAVATGFGGLGRVSADMLREGILSALALGPEL